MRKILIGMVLGMAGSLAAGMPEAQAAYKQGNEAARAGQWAAAIERYHEVLAQEASYAEYLDKPLGQAYLGAGDEGKALYHLTKALERHPEDARLAQQVKYLEARDVLPDSSGVKQTLKGEKLLHHHIFLNSGDLARGAMSLGYEGALGTHATWLLDAVYGTRSNDTGSYSTVGGGLGVHFWPTRFKGIFAGPKVTYQSADYEDSLNVYNYTTFSYDKVRKRGTVSRTSFGAEAGYQWLYESGVTLAFGYGYFYNQFNGGDPNASYYYSSSYYGGSGSQTQSSWLLTLGYAF